jgi:hypothetical protein
MSILGLSRSEKQAILDHHNLYRSRVARGLVKGQPQGADIVLLGWEERAASGSMKWAKTCTLGHNSNKERLFGSYDGIGQSSAAFVEAKTSPLKAVEFWFQQSDKYNHKKMTCATTSCGDYTQLVWGSTGFVGCASVTCPNDNLKTNTICQYAAGGNYEGESPYKAGRPCTSCPSNYPKCVKGLCATESQCARAGVACSNSEMTDTPLAVEKNHNPDGIIARV